jgi:hypothetical protein
MYYKYLDIFCFQWSRENLRVGVGIEKRVHRHLQLFVYNLWPVFFHRQKFDNLGNQTHNEKI